MKKPQKSINQDQPFDFQGKRPDQVAGSLRIAELCIAELCIAMALFITIMMLIAA